MRHVKKAATNWVQGSKTASRKHLYGKDLVHADGSPATADSTRPTMTTSNLGRRAVACHVTSLGVARSAGSGSTMIVQLSGVRSWMLSARHVSWIDLHPHSDRGVRCFGARPRSNRT